MICPQETERLFPTLYSFKESFKISVIDDFCHPLHTFSLGLVAVSIVWVMLTNDLYLHSFKSLVGATSFSPKRRSLSKGVSIQSSRLNITVKLNFSNKKSDLM